MLPVQFGLPQVRTGSGSRAVRFDDLGAHVAEESAGERAGDQSPDLDDADTVQRAGSDPRVASLLPAGSDPRVASLLPAGSDPRVASLLPAGSDPRVASLLPAGSDPRCQRLRLLESGVRSVCIGNFAHLLRTAFPRCDQSCSSQWRTVAAGYRWRRRGELVGEDR